MAGGGGGPRSATEYLRKCVIVALLVAGVFVLYRFGPDPGGGFDTRGLLVMGFVVLTSYTFGELVEVVKLPHITGYLIAGLLLGPGVWHVVHDQWHLDLGPFADGIMNPAVIGQFQPLESLALALIALTAGGELKMDQLRRDAKAIGGMLVGQSITTFAAVIGLIALISGVIPAISMPALAELPIGAALALGAVVATVSLATSPAATIAVINDVKANQGTMAKQVLSTVVLKDVVVVVLFSLAGTLAASQLGLSGSGDVVTTLAWHVLGSLAIGAMVGGAIALYLTSVGVEILLFLLGTMFTASYIAAEVHLDPALLFISAGFTAANFSKAGDKLIHSVEQLSLPVYVLFFTLAGAKLHLDTLAQVLPFALALVTARSAALFIGVRVGARLGGASEATVKHGWMGFVSQAGVAITLAGLVGSQFGESGRTLETLIIAGVAIHEVIGPIMLKVALGLAGEAHPDGAGTDDQEQTEETGPDPRDLAPWPEPEPGDPWGPPSKTSTPELDLAVREIEADLRGLVTDLSTGPLRQRHQGASDYLRRMRSAFLYQHRRLSVAAAQHADDSHALASLLRVDQTSLADVWREACHTRAASLVERSWQPERLVEALDDITGNVKETIDAKWEPATFESAEDESPVVLLGRTWLRLRRGNLGPRVVRLREVARYHLAGRAVARLEGLAALTVQAEFYLAARTTSLFDAIAAAYDDVATLVEHGEADEARVGQAMRALRVDVEGHFAAAQAELDTVADDGASRAARILGQAIADLKSDVAVIGTVDLPSRRRRFSHVYTESNRGLQALGERYQAGLRAARARYGLLSLELELMGLEGRVKEAVEQHSHELERNLRGRGPTQIRRVLKALDTAIVGLTQALDNPDIRGTDLITAIHDETRPLARVAADASRQAETLRAELTEERATELLLDALLRAANRLTETYTVPTGQMLEGEWTLPPPAPETEVPFRRVVLDYIESQVTRDLVALTRRLVTDVQPVATALRELERIVAFNAELAAAEVDPDPEVVPTETRALVRDMIVGALGRIQTRLQGLGDEADTWAGVLKGDLRAAVLDDLEALRTQIVAGRVSEVRLQLRAAAGRRRRAASELTVSARRVRDQLTTALTSTVGHERLSATRRALGLPQQMAAGSRFGLPERTDLPLVYRRLFSDQAMEAGDLLAGRQAELERGRAALETGDLRNVAIIGVDGIGKGAMVSALARSVDAKRVRELKLTSPATEADVEAWFADDRRGHLNVLHGIEWLINEPPQGMAALHALIRGVVSDAPANAWVLAADRNVWTTITRSAALHEAFPTVIELPPLTAHEMEMAVIARHTMSGYDLHFTPGTDLRDYLTRDDGDAQSRRRAAWFRQLHHTTRGVVHDALALWMASIEELDENAGEMRVGPVPESGDDRIRALPDSTLLTLRQIVRQGWTSAARHRVQFRTSHATAMAHLASLHHLGLVTSVDEENYRLSDAVRGSVQRVLSDRGWCE